MVMGTAEVDVSDDLDDGARVTLFKKCMAD